MRKIVFLLLTTITLSVSAQKSVLLRHNYTQGDHYAIKVDTKQDLGPQGSMSMNMTMGMIVEEANNQNIKTESKVVSISMDMLQGGTTTSYDSNKKEEELDQVGLMMKSQFDPLMKVVIYTTQDGLGNISEAKVEPAIPGAEQMTDSIKTLKFPEEKVSVGSSWTSKEETQGITMNIIYTVRSIENRLVTLDVSGNVTGAGTGTIKGEAIVDSSNGISKAANLEVTINTQGITIVSTTNTTTTKL